MIVAGVGGGTFPLQKIAIFYLVIGMCVSATSVPSRKSVFYLWKYSE